MKKINGRLLTIFLAFLCLLVNGQVKWSLKACFDTAYKMNISLQQGKLNSDVNKIKLGQSKAGLYPNLNLNDTHNINWGTSFDASLSQYVNSDLSLNNLSLNSSVTLYNGSLR